MNQKNAKRWKKLCLFVGVSLGMLAVLEAGQEMVKALDLSPVAIEDSPPVFAVVGTYYTDLEPDAIASASSVSGTEAAPQSDREATSSVANSSRDQLIAINTGAIADSQQSMPQVSANQIARTEWYGASFPVEGFQAYTSPFGYRSSPDGGYSTEFHYGLDMAAPEGSYIRNWWGGKVIEVSDDSNCGTSIVIESGEWMHIYCHMRGHVEEDNRGRYLIDRDGGIQIWEGEDIKAGDRIGRVGMTGRTTGPHLHWGLKYNENWVDPALVLRAMYYSQQAASQPPSNPLQ